MSNTELPRISIITPSYNQGKYIEKTIQSVIYQDYPNLEYIIIDGGSTDNTIEIIKKYEKHINYWCSEPDNGQSHAINKGIKKATGDVFNWLNSDDWYESGFLYEVAKGFITGHDMVTASVNFIYPNNNEIIGNFPSSKDIINVILSKHYLQPSTFYKMKFIRKVGGLNEKLHYCMDLELWYKYILINGLTNIKVLNNQYVNFLVHENSKSNLYQQRFENDIEYIFQKFDIPVETPKQNRNIWQQAVTEFFYRKLVSAYISRSKTEFDKAKATILFEHLTLRQKFNVIKFNLINFLSGSQNKSGLN